MNITRPTVIPFDATTDTANTSGITDTTQTAQTSAAPLAPERAAQADAPDPVLVARRAALDPARILWLSSSGVGSTGQPSSILLDALIDSPFGLISVNINGTTSITTLHSPDMARIVINAAGYPEVQYQGRARGLQLNPRQMAAAMFSCRARIRHLPPERQAPHQDAAEAFEAIGETLSKLHDLSRPAIDPGLIARLRLSREQLSQWASDLHMPPESRILHASRVPAASAQSGAPDPASSAAPQGSAGGWHGMRFLVQGSFQLLEITATPEVIEAALYPLDACELIEEDGQIRVDACERGLFISVKQASAALFMQRNHFRDLRLNSDAMMCAEAAGVMAQMSEAGVPHARRRREDERPEKAITPTAITPTAITPPLAQAPGPRNLTLTPGQQFESTATRAEQLFTEMLAAYLPAGSEGSPGSEDSEGERDLLEA